MSYAAALALAIGSYFSTRLPGLPADIATVWVESESGINNNPVGLTSGGSLIVYDSWEHGIDAAAAWVLNPTSPYGALRAALRGGDRYTIMRAIQDSPWGPAGYYHSAWPGVAKALGIALPTAPAAPIPTGEGTKVTTSTGNAIGDAIVTNAEYLANRPANPAPYVAKIADYATRLVTAAHAALVPVVSAPTAPDPAPAEPQAAAGSTWPWADIEQGSVPTAPPSIDTYGLLQQIAEIAGGYRSPDPETPSQWATGGGAASVLPQFVRQIIGDPAIGGSGALYWPVSAYPLLPAWVTDLAHTAADARS